MSITKKCKIDDCERQGKLCRDGKRYFIKGLCATHYTRLSRGQPVESNTRFTHRAAKIDGNIAKISLGMNAKDGYAVVDRLYSWVDKYKWNKSAQGYAITNTAHGNLRLHHLIIGKPTGGLTVDHINRDPLDNRISNLRMCTRSENQANRDKVRGKYKGVSLSENGKGFIAQIVFKGEKTHLGTYRDEEEAAIAYNKAAQRIHGEYAYLNVIKEK